MPLVAGVTSIGLDHTEYLGSTLEEIAREKAGIFKPGRPAVIGETDRRIRRILAEHARDAGASEVRVVAEEIDLEAVRVSDDGTSCDIEWRGERVTVRTPLAGRHQASNLAFSLVMLDAAGEPFATTLEDARQHVERVRIPGRFQHVGKFIFDVAHNPAGAEVLAQTVTSDLAARADRGRSVRAARQGLARHDSRAQPRCVALRADDGPHCAGEPGVGSGRG